MSWHSQSRDPCWDRLIHLVTGELSGHEVVTFFTWVNADPERKHALAEMPLRDI